MSVNNNLAQIRHRRGHSAAALAKGELKPGATIYKAGRLGEMQTQGDNILLGQPFIFNKDNIEQFDF